MVTRKLCWHLRQATQLADSIVESMGGFTRSSDECGTPKSKAPGDQHYQWESIGLYLQACQPWCTVVSIPYHAIPHCWSADPQLRDTLVCTLLVQPHTPCTVLYR